MSTGYRDARYELLHMGIGMTKVVAGIAVTRWAAGRWEVRTHGKYTCDLTSALVNLGLSPLEDKELGGMVSEFKEEIGCEYKTSKWDRMLWAEIERQSKIPSPLTPPL